MKRGAEKQLTKDDDGDVEENDVRTYATIRACYANSLTV